MTLTRRDALKLAAAAAATPLLPRGAAEAAMVDTAAPAAAAATAAAKPLAAHFFSAPEMALLDELVEMIIPADEHSGGARAAGVATYIDDRLFQYDPAIPVLKETVSFLETAKHDYGGHRAKAITDLRAAVVQLEKALKFSKTHNQDKP